MFKYSRTTGFGSISGKSVIQIFQSVRRKTVQILVVSVLLLVCYSCLSAANPSPKVLLSVECADEKYPDLPKGSYLHQTSIVCSRTRPVKEDIEKCVYDAYRIDDTSGYVTLYQNERTAKIKDACKYVEAGFDIFKHPEIGITLRPGYRTTLEEYQSRTEVRQSATDYTWLNFLAWTFYRSSIHLGVNTPEDIPEDCSYTNAYLIEETSLLEILCEDTSQMPRCTIMPHYPVCDVDQGYANHDGQLICRHSWRALLDYSLGTAGFSHLGVDEAHCTEAGGDFQFIKTSEHPIRLIYTFRNSGFYLCIDKSEETREWLDKIDLIRTSTIVGYDLTLDLLVARTYPYNPVPQFRQDQMGKIIPTRTDYSALYKPRLCLDMGLNIKIRHGVLYCAP